MNEGLIARRYAKALYAYAAERGEEQALYGRMQTLAAALAALPDLSEALRNPTLSSATGRRCSTRPPDRSPNRRTSLSFASFWRATAKSLCARSPSGTPTITAGRSISASSASSRPCP